MTEGINKNKFASNKERPRATDDGLSFLNDLKKTAEKKLKKEKKRIVNLQGDLTECDSIPLIRKTAELLKANLKQIKRGMKSIAVDDFFSNKNDKFIIELDCSRPAREQVNRLFKKAKKLEKSEDKLNTQIELANDRIKNISEFISKIEIISDEKNNLELLDKLLVEAKEIGITTVSKCSSTKQGISKKQSVVDSLMKSVRKFKSYDDLDIFVGKSNRDNDILSFRIAKGNDWWFHIAPCAGSHVLVKNDGRDSLPQETMLDAASLAVYYSKMRGATQTDVHYTQAKNVRRIKGAPPGKVRLERNKTLRIRIEENRYDRIFAKK